MKYSGADWVEQSLEINNMSVLGKEVADLLGDVFLGIYHLNTHTLPKVKWDDDHYIEVVIYDEISTVDDNKLTRLVVLCHDRMIRVTIKGCGPHLLKLGFSKRESRDGDLYARCPTIENHIQQIRAHYLGLARIE